MNNIINCSPSNFPWRRSLQILVLPDIAHFQISHNITACPKEVAHFQKEIREIGDLWFFTSMLLNEMGQAGTWSNRLSLNFFEVL